MDDSRRERLGHLLEQALALPAARRSSFLAEACGEDRALLEELRSLLSASESSAGWFERIAGEVVVPALEAAAVRSGSRHIGSDDLPPGELVAHYEIVERVGGGMGVVYRARDLRLGRPVALKLLPRELASDDRARDRLYAEARAASALDHPNICTVYEIGEAARGGLFIALAWCDGETLKDRLARDRMEPADAVAIVRQIASALAAAHDAGIVHRDVKPSNIICTPQGQAKLVDFGIAKLPDADVTREGVTPGTVAYMSPEQTRAGAIDARTDVWSLGVVLYEMVAGRRPFRGESEATLIHAIRHDPPEPLAQIRPDVPAPLAAIVTRCLEKTPAERYAHAGELFDALSASADARPADSASPHTPAWRNDRQRVRRFWPRAALLAGAVAALAFAANLLRPDADAGQGSLAAATSPIDGRPSLAVLPFENRSGRVEDQYFTDGLQDEIRTRLAGLAALRVSSRTSVMQYRASPKDVREIAAELNVSHVLEGGLQRAGDSVRVFVRLVDARSDAQLWAREYDAALDVAGIFGMQREIAENVAEALSIELSEAEQMRVARAPTTDLEAYRHYLIGRRHWNERTPDGMDSAYVHFQEALLRDSLYARAYAGLADVHVLGYGPAGSGGYRLAIENARTALRLDSLLPEAHTSLAFALMSEWKWQEAGDHYRRAIALDPEYATAHQWYAEYLVSQGRMEEAIAESRLAERLDPVSPIIAWNVSRILAFARDYDAQLAQLRHLARLYPADDHIVPSLVVSLTEFGQYAEAADVLERFLTPATARSPREDADRYRWYVERVRAGDGSALLSFMREVQPSGTQSEGHQRMFAAMELAASGDMDAAIALIEQAQLSREFGAGAPDLVAGYYFDAFRDDERFNDVLRRMGLDPRIGLALRRADPRWPPRPGQVPFGVDARSPQTSFR